jgi:hypothetical protein
MYDSATPNTRKTAVEARSGFRVFWCSVVELVGSIWGSICILSGIAGSVSPHRLVHRSPKAFSISMRQLQTSGRRQHQSSKTQ